MALELRRDRHMSLLADFRYAGRTLAHSPGFTLGATLTLALGIGANTAIFSLIHGVLIRPLPYRDPGRLVRIHETEPELFMAPITAPDFLDFRARARLFDDMASYAPDGATLTGGDRPERVQVTVNTHNIFSILGASPILGRDFLPEDEQAKGHHGAVVLSYGLWQRRFGGDPGLVRRTILLDGQKCDVIGIMPKDFRPLWRADLWIASSPPRDDEMRASHDRFAVGRLKSGVSLEQAQAEMAAIAKQLESEHPNTNKSIGVRLSPLAKDVVGEYTRRMLLVLFGAVAFVLLIACANVASLLLARGAARQRELAIRAAVGASRWHLVRQLLAESLVLAVCGGVAGLLLAVWGVDLLRHSTAFNIPRADEIGLDATLLGYTALASVLTGILFGLAPALQLSRCDLANRMRENGSRTVAGGKSSGLRAALVSGEIALAVGLLIGAGLMVRSFLHLISVEPGFHASGVLTAETALPGTRYRTDEQKNAFARDLTERLRGIPGVKSASITSKLPLAGGNNGTILVEGQPFSQGEMEGPLVEYTTVLPGYFQAMGIPLRAGRDFTQRDLTKDPTVVIVNEALVRRFFPDQEALAKHISRERRPPSWLEIIGVVGDTRQFGLASPAMPELYQPAAWGRLILVVQATVDPAGLVTPLRREVAAMDRDLPLYSVQTMEDAVTHSSARMRSITALLGVFAGIALALAAIGVYGLVSFSLSRRQHEIGIRLALGATRGNVIVMALRDSMKLIAAGLLLGLMGAFALTRYVASLLFGVNPVDPVTFFAVPLFLAAVALAASYIPALQATAIDPAAALRHE